MIKLSDLKKYKKAEWYVEHCPASPIILSGVVKGITYNSAPKNSTYVLAYFEKGEMDYITLIKDQNNVGRAVVKNQLDDKNYSRIQFGKLLKIRKEIETNFRRIKNTNLSKLSDNDFLKEFKKYTELEIKERRVAGCADSFIFYSERRLTYLLNEFKKKHPKLDNINEAMEILARPIDPSFLNEAEMELIGIAKRIKEGCAKDKIKDLILKHIDKYCWIKGSFVGGKEYAFNDVYGEIKELLDSNLEEELLKNESWKKNARIKEGYISEYKFGKEILAITELSSTFAKLQDIRKESTLIAAYLHTFFVKEFARRNNAKVENVLMLCDYEEVKDFLDGKLTEKELSQRREGNFLVVFHKDEYKILLGEDVYMFVKNITKIENKQVREIKGTVASRGKATGRTRIVIDEKDVYAFRQGEILVSTMTRPDHMVAMKKAVAIVTNEGGITCHAAIISRELGVPCIIGTKIATKVLKDGDLVEVDADNGIIKILEKNENK